jgi:hypothetical protein
MRITTIGSVAISAELTIKYNSRNKFSLFFWDDVGDTIPSSLVGATITIEIDDTTLVTWTATNVVNEAVFDQAATTVQFTWDAKPYRVVITKAGPIRDVVFTGTARIQR